MDLRRLRAGEWLTGLAGVLLLVALFLPWYGDDAATRTGWQALVVLDVVLALLALAAVAVPVVTAAYRVPAVPLAHQSLLVLAALAVDFILFGRVLNMPDWATGRELGLWLGFLAALGIFGAALLAIRDERRSPDGRHTDLTGVPVASPRPIETRPAPPPGPES